MLGRINVTSAFFVVVLLPRIFVETRFKKTAARKSEHYVSKDKENEHEEQISASKDKKFYVVQNMMNVTVPSATTASKIQAQNHKQKKVVTSSMLLLFMMTQT